MFVQLLAFSSMGAKFNDGKDTQRINEVLTKLQNSGSTIKGVTPSIAGSGGACVAVYVIQYEASGPISI